jgi:hypothetical protein
MQFDSDKKMIAFSSNFGETISVDEPIFTTTAVEHWLLELSTKSFDILEALFGDYISGNLFFF